MPTSACACETGRENKDPALFECPKGHRSLVIYKTRRRTTRSETSWLQGGDHRCGASRSCYSSILRPNSVNATEGILNRSIACAELRDMNENSATRQRER